MLTQERLKEVVLYCPETGIFTNRKTRGRAKVGKQAGHNGASGCGRFDRIICIDYVDYKAHRLAFLYMTGSFPSDEVDHIDGDSLNNAWENLREASRLMNSQNMPKRRDNKSGVTGVSWFKPVGMWQAAISANKKMIHLGYSHNLFEAICKRKSAELTYGFHQNHGRVACCPP